MADSTQSIHVDFPGVAFGKLQKELDKFLRGDALNIVGMEALSFIRMNFNKQGFTGFGGFRAWKKRKKPANMYYMHGKRRGQLTKAGQRYLKKKGRPLFSSSSGRPMRDSFDYMRQGHSVKIYSHLSYAFYHNYGTDRLPKRMFIGPSGYLNSRIAAKINGEVLKRFQGMQGAFASAPESGVSAGFNPNISG